MCCVSNVLCPAVPKAPGQRVSLTLSHDITSFGLVTSCGTDNLCFDTCFTVCVCAGVRGSVCLCAGVVCAAPRCICVIVRVMSCFATSAHKNKHTAAHCNTLQHTATHCNTLQHTANFATSAHKNKAETSHWGSVYLWFLNSMSLTFLGRTSCDDVDLVSYFMHKIPWGLPQGVKSFGPRFTCK